VLLVCIDTKYEYIYNRVVTRNRNPRAAEKMSLSQEEELRRAALKQGFRDLYPTTSNAALSERFSLPLGTIQRWAQELGLKKDPSYHAEVQRRNATGRVLSKVDREKLRQKALGRKLSDDTKTKILDTKRKNGTLRKGEQHYKWKGGRPWERFKHPEYLAWRNAVLERDGYVCQHCGRQCKKYERGLAAHHIRPYADYPDLRYEVSNGITLCRQCHMSIHGKAPMPKEQIPCACGCGTMIDPIDRYGRPRRYVNYHGARGRTVAQSAKQALRDQRKGKTLTPEHRTKIASSLRSSYKRVGRPPKSSK
jgi:5-methylcytosine-specific restriction endonuclease McrA